VKQAQIWVGGNGHIQHKTIARSEAEALNNIIEKEPLLLAIGCYAEPMELVDGHHAVALVPDKYVFGDDRRNKAAKEEEDIIG
jgi:hypothetical protein